MLTVYDIPRKNITKVLVEMMKEHDISSKMISMDEVLDHWEQQYPCHDGVYCVSETNMRKFVEFLLGIIKQRFLIP